MSKWLDWFNRIPQTVQVSRKGKYEVLWTDKIKEDDRTLGETRFDPKQIVIKTGQTYKESVSTYLHEFLHAVSEEYEVGLTEKQVRALEKAVYFVLKEGNVFK